MAWRWNLDYVVDPHGNSMSYWYGQETNVYGRNLNPGEASTYVRGGYLSEIDYGTTTGAELGGTAPVRVLLTVADRCLPNTTCDTAHPSSWPDVPWDQTCTGAPCSNASPAFFTQKRLAGVKTQVWGGTAYRDVESWTLNHTYPDPGDGTRAGLWLAGISHSGLVGGTASVPDVTFNGVQMSNRVDPVGDGAPPMNWWRVQNIYAETGGEVTVQYSAAQCAPGSVMPSSPDQNLYLCFPVYWVKPGQISPGLDWFQKYVVTSVSESDLTGGNPRVYHAYTYVGSPAWHYDDDDGLVPVSRKSWAQWRGYGDVQVYTGDPPVQTEGETLYFRGMDGDKLSTGGTRSVKVTGSDGTAWTDSAELAGMAHEQVSYSAPSPTNSFQSGVLSGTISDPWSSPPTSSRTINGSTVYARFTGTADQTSRTALDGSRAWRVTRVINTYDPTYGVVVQTDDQGDTSLLPSQEVCYRYTYARNSTAWLMSYESRVEKYALPCSQTAQTSDDVIGDTWTAYDGQAFGAAPTRGDVTAVEAVKAWSPGNPGYVTTSRAAFDANGRQTDTWDALDNHTQTVYSPTSGGPVTGVTKVDPMGFAEVDTMEPAWGLALSKVDPNSNRTDLAYDALGRLTSVWLPGRLKGTQTPNYSYTYTVTNNAAVAVTTQTLNQSANYVTTSALYDGLSRPRQTQAPAPGGGAVVTDTFYNSTGKVSLTYGAYNTSSNPGVTLVTPVNQSLVPTQNATFYDSAGRVSASVYEPGGIEAWRTSTAYGGDRVDTTPPAGGTATSTVTDARGRTVELRQYHGTTPSGAYDSTFYAYNRKGQLAAVTDPAGNQWSYGYDLMGREATDTSPDYGATRSQYDDAGELVQTTDQRGLTLAYKYDASGRKTEVHDTSITGPLRAQWTYDTLKKGYLTSSKRIVNGSSYTVAVLGYTNRYSPTGQVITIPAAEGALAGTYTFRDGWMKVDGKQSSIDYPAAGGLSEEVVGYYYDATLGLLQTAYSNASTYVAQTSYSSIGQLLQLAMAVSPTAPSTWQTYSYENGTNRLHQSMVSRQLQSPSVLSQVIYSYDNAGNVTEAQDFGSNAGPTDTQCFSPDYLRRLSQAWTPASNDCTQAPSNAGLGGPAPYWQSWQYDLTGNRVREVDHATSSGDTTITYSYNPAGQPQPHTLQSTSTTDSTGTRTASYTYDAAGNTWTRPGVSGQQQLTWDSEGHLATLTDGSASNSYVYDADGSRLISHDGGGATLYLPATELRLNGSTGQVTGTRYYEFAGHQVAMRTPSGLSWLFNDPQGTNQITIAAADQSHLERRQAPFGTPRGAAPGWPADRGFVNGVVDPTGLTHLGAREYDPGPGRFISADPIVDHSNPQQMNGYAYANDSPVTSSDPSGRYADSGDSCDPDCPGLNEIKDSVGNYGEKERDPLPPPLTVRKKPVTTPRPANPNGCARIGTPMACGNNNNDGPEGSRQSMEDASAAFGTLSLVTGGVAVVCAMTGLEPCVAIADVVSITSGLVATGLDTELLYTARNDDERQKVEFNLGVDIVGLAFPLMGRGVIALDIRLAGRAAASREVVEDYKKMIDVVGWATGVGPTFKQLFGG